MVPLILTVGPFASDGPASAALPAIASATATIPIALRRLPRIDTSSFDDASTPVVPDRAAAGSANGPEMAAHPAAVAARVAGEVGGALRPKKGVVVAAAIVGHGVPGPREVGDAEPVGEAHEPLREVGVAVRVAEPADHDRIARREPP